jgi:hypothetical protein
MKYSVESRPYLRTQLALHIGVIEYWSNINMYMDGGELSAKMGGSFYNSTNKIILKTTFEEIVPKETRA